MIELGDQLPDLTLTILDSDGNPQDGGAVTLAITLPDNQVVPVIPTRDSQGHYSAVYTAVQAGIHVCEWNVTGSYAGTYRDTKYVEQSVSIVSLEQVKEHLGISRTSHDETLRMLALMASDACESGGGTNRRWRRRVITNERHTAARVFQLYNAPVVSVQSVTVDGTAATDADYDIDLRTGLVYGLSYGMTEPTRRFGTVWNYVAGGSTVPPVVREGVLEMVRHLYQAHQGGSRLPSQSEPEYTTSLGYLIPNRVAWAWRHYRMPG